MCKPEHIVDQPSVIYYDEETKQTVIRLIEKVCDLRQKTLPSFSDGSKALEIQS